jgi:phosphatidylglycerol---prolipoprotein diacylglyceryl transferase
VLQITIAIDPTLVSLGPLTLRWSGLMIAIGITIGLIVASRETRRRGLSDEVTFACAFWSGVGAVVGARFFHVVDRLDFYLQNPDLILGLQPGGMAVWGGLVGGIAAGSIYVRWRRLPFGVMADTAAPAILVGLIVGRTGSIVNGDAHGLPTSLPWGLIYLHPDTLVPFLGTPTEPYPIYEMIWNGLLLGALWRFRGHLSHPGATFLTFISGYAVGIFVLTFVRQERIWLLGLQGAQIIAVIAIALSLLALLRLVNRDREYHERTNRSFGTR